MMEIYGFKLYQISECANCGQLFIAYGQPREAVDMLDEQYGYHLRDFPECKKWHDNLPTFDDIKGILKGGQTMNLSDEKAIAALMGINPIHLVKYLYDNLKDWGYEECPKCQGTNQYSGDNYTTQCFCGTGKVLTERAKRFKAVMEGK
jgi:hypothetical protein